MRARTRGKSRIRPLTANNPMAQMPRAIHERSGRIAARQKRSGRPRKSKCAVFLPTTTIRYPTSIPAV